MLRSAIPLRFTYAWGAQASGAYIRTVPVNSQIGVQDGAASMDINESSQVWDGRQRRVS